MHTGPLTRRSSRSACASALCSLFFFLAFARPAAALDPSKAATQYGHRSWGVDEGLPQGSVQTITQTRDGYLWAGTQEGFVRFDGVRFTTFDSANTPGLRNDNIFRLLEDRHGNLWVATAGGGLSRMRGERVLETFTAASGLPNDLVHTLYEDRAGVLWIGTAGGLCRLRDGVIEVVTGGGLESARIWAIREDAEGSLWIGTGNGVVRMRGGSIEDFATQPGLGVDPVRSLYEDRNKTLWIGTHTGLARFEQGRIVADDALQGSGVLSLMEDRDGSLWIGTDSGLYHLGVERAGLARRIPQFAGDRVWSMHEDREGSMWFGTVHSGLQQLRDQRVTTFSSHEGLTNDVAWSVLEDRNGVVWIGTGGGGLNRLEKGSIRALTTEDGLPGNSVFSLAEDRKGGLWIGTEDGGVSRLHAGKLESFTAQIGRPGIPVRVIHEDAGGVLWFGSSGGGLVRWEKGTARRYSATDGLTNESVMALAHDRAGALWIGTFGGGLFRFAEGRFTKFGTKEGLANGVVLALHAAADGALWIGTNGGGLNRLKDGSIVAWTIAQGLPDDSIFEIVPGAEGHLWLSSNKGVFRLDVRDLDEVTKGRRPQVAAVVYGRADGMRSAECNGGQHPAGWRAKDGRLWFPTTRGVVVIDPANEREHVALPHIRIEHLAVDGEQKEPSAEVVMPAGATALEITYTAPSFVLPDRLRFRYRLEGVDRQWVDAGARRTAYYTSLPPGRFRFRVEAVDGNGSRSEASALGVVRLPALHETKSFYFACGTGGLLALFGVHRLRVRHLRGLERALAVLVERRTRELAEANEDLEAKNKELDSFSYSVSHDLRAPIRAIDGFSHALEEDYGPRLDAQGMKYLKYVRESTKSMTGLIEALLSLARVTRSGMNVEPVDVSALARRVSDRLIAAHPERAVEIVIAPGLLASGDERLLEAVLENLLGNAWKFTGKRTTARVEVGSTQEGPKTKYFVRDNGAGFDPAYGSKLFGAFQRLHSSAEFEGTGIGLATVHRILQRHGGRIWAVGEIDRGATFWFTLWETRRPETVAGRAG